MTKKKRIVIKRVYEKPSREDGIRILVDRLWPRGVSKDEAKLDYWFKELAPSTLLRKWYNHEPEKFEEFVKKYKKELKNDEAQQSINQIRKLAQSDSVTLVFAAKDVEHSNARVLEEILKK